LKINYVDNFACWCCAEVIRAAPDTQAQLAMVCRKWEAARALLLDFGLFNQYYEKMGLDVVLPACHQACNIRELHLRWLTCPRPNTLTTWVRAALLFLYTPYSVHHTGACGD
jgi:hypothetical protein